MTRCPRWGPLAWKGLDVPTPSLLLLGLLLVIPSAWNAFPLSPDFMHCPPYSLYLIINITYGKISLTSLARLNHFTFPSSCSYSSRTSLEHLPKFMPLSFSLNDCPCSSRLSLGCWCAGSLLPARCWVPSTKQGLIGSASERVNRQV